MTFRKAYDKHKRFPTECVGESKTQQQFKRECDINHLMAKYQKTGLMTHVNLYQGDYSDLTDLPDYQTSLNKVMDAQAAFDSLPSKIRAQFNNEPSLFLDFVSDSSNIDEMIEMGLATKHNKTESKPVELDPPVQPVETQTAGGEL